jgi:Tfp pilus assembly protein PilF
MVAFRLVRCQILACAGLACMAHAGGAPAGAAGAAGVAGVAGVAFKAPYIPASDGEVLQEVPSAADPAVADMMTLRRKFDASHGLPAALDLARAYVDYSRQIGDAHYAGYAEAVIAPWMAQAPPPPGALVMHATILQYRHQFAEARALLRRAIDTEPRNAQAWLTLATLDMVQGNYAAAGSDCTSVANSASLELGLACTGNVRSYIGQAHQSLVLLRQAAAAASSVPLAYRAWVQGLIAETAERLGDWSLAERHYRNALKLMPRDNFLLVAYADFLLDRGRPQEVLPLLADHIQSDTAFLRIALAQSALGGADAERDRWLMAARFEALRLRGSDYFGREQARFALELQHDPQTALDLAQRNWQLQRAPWDARVLLEAAQAANRPEAATQVLEFLHETKLEDPIIEPLARALRSRVTSASGANP